MKLDKAYPARIPWDDRTGYDVGRLIHVYGKPHRILLTEPGALWVVPATRWQRFTAGLRIAWMWSTQWKNK